MRGALWVGWVAVVLACVPDRDERPRFEPVQPVVAAARAAVPEPAETEAPAAPSDPAVRDPARPPPTLSAFDAGNRCERFRLTFDDEGRPRYRRLRRTWSAADRRRFASLVNLVANEMGADPRLFRAWAMRESSYRPHALHVLDPDVEAATAAWRRLRYSPTEEAELQRVLASVSARDPAYWEAKARLHRVRTFRDNAFLDAVIPLDVLLPDGRTSQGSEHAWAFGYGAFGFNPAYFVPVWDARAPPWVFCQDDGLVAIITAVWVARAAKRECEAQGLPGSYAVVDRRFSRGHCGPVGPHAKFRQRARGFGLDPDENARLGRKWPRARTDRAEIHGYMRQRAVEEGLLPAPRPSGA